MRSTSAERRAVWLRTISTYFASVSGVLTRSSATVSATALNSETGVLSWCDTCATKSACMRATCAARWRLLIAITSATSMSRIESPDSQYPCMRVAAMMMGGFCARGLITRAHSRGGTSAAMRDAMSSIG